MDKEEVVLKQKPKESKWMKYIIIVESQDGEGIRFAQVPYSNPLECNIQLPTPQSGKFSETMASFANFLIAEYYSRGA